MVKTKKILEGFEEHRSDLHRIQKRERAEQRMALLYKQLILKYGRTVASCAHGVIGRNDALSVGRVF